MPVGFLGIAGRPALKLALELQIGFLLMTGRLLEAVHIVPPARWRHLGASST
jgi:hypothetical protein